MSLRRKKSTVKRVRKLRIVKSGAVKGTDKNEDELRLVNDFAKAELKESEVYIFSVLLCDNEVDRDMERFTDKTLSELSELFVGATGICDHDWRSENQVARIYRTELVSDAECKNSLGEPYRYLKGHAYMLRTPQNEELIAQIEGGIKRETSVGCSVKHRICSVCGEEMGTCPHEKGAVYGGELCYCELCDAVDAYEWSFVAVPAQRSAGVIKSLAGFAESENGGAFKAEYEALKAKAETGERYLASLREEIKRLCLICDEGMYETVCMGLCHMDEKALVKARASFAEKAEKLCSPVCQLPGKKEVTAFSGDEYII